MIPKILILSNKNQGSSLSLPAHGWVGARATSSLAAHFALQNTLSKSAEKKASPSEGEAEGGCGGNSAFLLPNQIEDSPATCLNTWKAGHHRKILFSLREKEIRRPKLNFGIAICNHIFFQKSMDKSGTLKNEKSKEYFSVVWRACRAMAGLASLVGVLLKECSNFVQKTPPKFQNGFLERKLGRGVCAPPTLRFLPLF